MNRYFIVKVGDGYMVKDNDWIMYAGDSYQDCVEYILDILI